MKILDYYEFLQISPNAEPGTIHRVYRFLAGRFTDNPETGDAEKFFLLKQPMTYCPIETAAPNTMRLAKRMRLTQSPCPLPLILWMTWKAS